MSILAASVTTQVVLYGQKLTIKNLIEQDTKDMKKMVVSLKLNEQRFVGNWLDSASRCR